MVSTAALGTGADLGKIVFTSTATGAGNVTIGGADAALITGGGGAATAGTNINTSANRVFTVAGLGGVADTITLSTNITSAADLVAAISGQLNAGSLVSVAAGTGADAGKVVFTSDTAGAGKRGLSVGQMLL